MLNKFFPSFIFGVSPEAFFLITVFWALFFRLLVGENVSCVISTIIFSLGTLKLWAKSGWICLAILVGGATLLFLVIFIHYSDKPQLTPKPPKHKGRPIPINPKQK